MNYIKPEASAKSFTCPHCATISKQDWWSRNWYGSNVPNESQAPIKVGTCQHCLNTTVWVINEMVFPAFGTAPTSNTEMPQDVKKLYQEAAMISSKSPRGAAALLRLAIQILCKDLGEDGKNINSNIASLVEKGLPSVVQQSLDIVRVTGNDAVHPGQIDTDDPIVVQRLFDLLNIIVEYMIALPKRVSGIYASLPTDKKDAISKRDL
ncbi:DUF4145 domain-containing protein [Chryseobacterium chendengshani]|uniref:DUF4145 domain-containing protein n=1 Tax=Chryseobacterium sp. LJ756 TaxID=2864113 RepID=UPI001C644204|nr:DUF4145 domain-containing protein [Chryseobacterium sp. LJ756]MBW7675652.1 DUF4145 domain-containing protein [Chryseobacterium sp. LJ756]